MKPRFVFLALVGAIGILIVFAPSRPEPGAVIVTDHNGQKLKMEELTDATGTYPFEIVGERNVPANAKLLHDKGREAGSRGDNAKALDLFSQAAALAPDWPYPVYDRAFTHMLMKNFVSAREDYAKTVKLSPRGFFTAITAVDALEREQKGEFPEGTYLAYVSLEWTADREKKLAAVRKVVARVPQFAPAWKELAWLVDEEEEKKAAVEKALALNPDAETKGILLINQALMLAQQGDRQGAMSRLKRLAEDTASTFGTERMAKASLEYMVKNPAR